MKRRYRASSFPLPRWSRFQVGCKICLQEGNKVKLSIIPLICHWTFCTPPLDMLWGFGSVVEPQTPQGCKGPEPGSQRSLLSLFAGTRSFQITLDNPPTSFYASGPRNTSRWYHKERYTAPNQGRISSLLRRVRYGVGILFVPAYS